MIEHLKTTTKQQQQQQQQELDDQGIKQVQALQALKSDKNKQDIKSIDGIFPKEIRTNQIKNQIYETKKWEEKN